MATTFHIFRASSTSQIAHKISLLIHAWFLLFSNYGSNTVTIFL